MPKHVTYFQAPAVYTVPLQLLAYHVATLKGTDVNQPRGGVRSDRDRLGVAGSHGM
jgi:glucosamine--fructose-6-phosphate aminotransferase (isomerizing)